jgi:alkaline phosphatase
MKKTLISLLTLILFTALGCSTSAQKNQATSPTGPRNVILLIGDGMGLSQVSSAFFYKDSAPNFKRFKHIGLIRTSSSKQKVTDSAAGATAFSTGVKTYNGAISVNDDTLSIPTIVEVLHDQNWATGVISTSSITHATPAAFYAHVASRNMHEAIANDLANSNIDFFAGGGQKYFTEREDGNDLLAIMESQGFKIDTSLNKPAKGERLGYFLAENALPTMLDGRGEFLTQASLKAITFLESSSENYFLMVEGSQIDWGGHDKDADYLISELIDFDNTIGAILDKINPEETLVIVTADHETGGFTLSAKPSTTEDGRRSSNYAEIEPSFSTDGHSATLIPVFAYGNGAENFAGIYENNEICHKIMALVAQ